MTNGYHHKVYVFGDQTKADVINFGYSTNASEFNLEEIIKKNPLHFSTAGFISINLKLNPASFQELEDTDLLARLKIEIDEKIKITEESLDIDFIKSEKCGPNIYLLTRENYETEALNKRILGQDVKTLGSLIVRSVRATATRDDNLFLHACAVVDPDAKALYIVASDEDHAGKTPMVNDILRATKNGKLLTTALRLKVRRSDGACFAYPQNNGEEVNGKETNTIYTLIRYEEEKLFKENTQTSLLDIGFKKHEHPDNKLLAANKILISIDGYESKIDLSKYRVFLIFAGHGSQKWDNKPRVKSISKTVLQQKLYDSWLSTWQFKGEKLFDKINTKNYDKKLIEKYSADAHSMIEKLLNKINYYFVYEGIPYNVRKHILIEACKVDILSDGEKGLEWYRANTPEISEFVESEFRKIRFERSKQLTIEETVKIDQQNKSN